MRRVTVRESHAVVGDGINVRSRNVFATIDADVGVAEVIGKEDNDIGFVGARDRCRCRA